MPCWPTWKTLAYLLLELQHCHHLHLFFSVTQVDGHVFFVQPDHYDLVDLPHGVAWGRMTWLNVCPVIKRVLRVSLSFWSAGWSLCYIGSCAISSDDSPERRSVGFICETDLCTFPSWLHVSENQTRKIYEIFLFFWWRTSAAYRPWICNRYSISTARIVFAMSPSLRRYSWNASKGNGGEKRSCGRGLN